jgi:curved DNA-binding protein CbpA
VLLVVGLFFVVYIIMPEIRAKNDEARRILEAAAEGNRSALESETVSNHTLRTAICHSGCSALHWAAGCNQIAVVEYLVLQRKLAVDLPAVKKSRDRTPLHYAGRNGCLEAAQWLVAHGAHPNARAKHGVTPFQLAVWQNRLEICQWLVSEHKVDPAQVNDFDCGAVHWLGICPHTNTNNANANVDLIPLAEWLAQQPGVTFHSKQRQGHTPLHKAAWGGHLSLIQWLHTEQDLWDDAPDDAGNYAADLADMAHTPHHTNIAQYLRHHCSRARANSCVVLGVEASASLAEIRKAYLHRARRVHPDHHHHHPGNEEPTNIGFDALHKAYRHLMDEGGRGNQANPAHSLKLMLQVSGQDTLQDDDSCFKARLIAVLLEYGDKGLDLSNVKKKWKQVWPTAAFPEYDNDEGTAKRVSLSEFLVNKAGDVVAIVRDEKGAARVFAKDCSQSKVAQAAANETSNNDISCATVVRSRQCTLEPCNSQDG